MFFLENEIAEIIGCNHSQPHNILGQHKYTKNDKEYLCITTFLPSAKSVSVKLDNGEIYLLEKLYIDGVFSINLEGYDYIKYEYEIEYYNGDKYITRDPYTFAPTFTDVDQYLFAEGTHYEIYEKMGARITNVDGVDGVSFSVWAPNARRVSVIGSFNSWDGRVHPMRILGSSGVWELFIPNIKEYDNYKFEIKTQEGNLLQKADPYAIFNELRPSQSSLVYDNNDYKWADSEYLENRRKNHPINGPISIYEVHIGSWRRIVTENENRFMSYVEACEMLIPYVKEMGYTHIELMAISEHPFDGSWGYQVTGYYASTSRFGTPKQLMAFIDKCHQEGIGVIIDWVPAHFVKDAHALGRFDGTALYEHADPKQGEHPDWGTYIFNYGRNEVKNFLIGSALQWLEKYHFDGIRIDAVASMLYLDYGKTEGNWIPNQYGGRENIEAMEFLKHLNSVILSKDSSYLMIAEESTSWPGVTTPVESGGLGFNLKWNMGWMNDTNRYIKEDPINRRYHHSDLTFSMVYAYTEKFILVLSHDEVVHGKGSMINKMPGDNWQKFANLRTYYSYMYGHPGKKLLFMGQEFGQYDEWNEAKSIDWHLLNIDCNKGMQNYTKDLNHLYINEPALHKYDFDPRGFHWLDSNNYEQSLLGYIRKGDKDDNDIIVINNFTPVVRENYKIWVPYPCEVTEVLNSDDLKYGGSGVINTNTIASFNEGGQNYIILQVPPLGSSFLRVKSL